MVPSVAGVETMKKFRLYWDDERVEVVVEGRNIVDALKNGGFHGKDFSHLRAYAEIDAFGPGMDFVSEMV